VSAAASNNRGRLVLGPAECPVLRRPAEFDLRREGELWLAENRALGVRAAAGTVGEAAEAVRSMIEYTAGAYLLSGRQPAAAPDLVRAAWNLARLVGVHADDVWEVERACDADDPRPACTICGAPASYALRARRGPTRAHACAACWKANLRPK